MCVSGRVWISGCVLAAGAWERSSGELDEQHHKHLALKRLGACV